MLAGTVTVPSAFTTSPDPTGTVLDVICTFPAAVPTTTGLPFKVSLLVNAVVVPPGNPLTEGVVSVTATIAGALTTTVELIVLQFNGLFTSQIV